MICLVCVMCGIQSMLRLGFSLCYVRFWSVLSALSAADPAEVVVPDAADEPTAR